MQQKGSLKRTSGKIGPTAIAQRLNGFLTECVCGIYLRVYMEQVAEEEE